MNRGAFILLVLCNFVWALNSFMGKTLIRSFHGVQVAWFRYVSGFAVYFLFAVVRVAFGKRKWSDYFLRPKSRRIALEIAVLGVGAFVFSPILQFVGLETAQAMENSILIATEPLITVALAWAILGEKMNRAQTTSMILAIVGVVFFTGLLGLGATGFSIGLIYLLLAQFGESGYSVFGKKLALVHEPKAILGSALALGACLLTVFTVAFDKIPSLGALGASEAGAIFWIGPLGSTLTYLIWTSISKKVTVASMAITLFVQPLVGSLAGYLLLGERLTVGQLFGAILIFISIAFLAVQETRRGNRQN